MQQLAALVDFCKSGPPSFSSRTNPTPSPAFNQTMWCLSWDGQPSFWLAAAGSSCSVSSTSHAECSFSVGRKGMDVVIADDPSISRTHLSILVAGDRPRAVGLNPLVATSTAAVVEQRLLPPFPPHAIDGGPTKEIVGCFARWLLGGMVGALALRDSSKFGTVLTFRWTAAGEEPIASAAHPDSYRSVALPNDQRFDAGAWVALAAIDHLVSQLCNAQRQRESWLSFLMATNGRSQTSGGDAATGLDVGSCLMTVYLLIETRRCIGLADAGDLTPGFIFTREAPATAPAVCLSWATRTAAALLQRCCSMDLRLGSHGAALGLHWFSLPVCVVIQGKEFAFADLYGGRPHAADKASAHSSDAATSLTRLRATLSGLGAHLVTSCFQQDAPSASGAAAGAAAYRCTYVDELIPCAATMAALCAGVPFVDDDYFHRIKSRLTAKIPLPEPQSATSLPAGIHSGWWDLLDRAVDRSLFLPRPERRTLFTGVTFVMVQAELCAELSVFIPITGGRVTHEALPTVSEATSDPDAVHPWCVRHQHHVVVLAPPLSVAGIASPQTGTAATVTNLRLVRQFGLVLLDYAAIVRSVLTVARLPQVDGPFPTVPSLPVAKHLVSGHLLASAHQKRSRVRSEEASGTGDDLMAAPVQGTDVAGAVDDASFGDVRTQLTLTATCRRPDAEECTNASRGNEVTSAASGRDVNHPDRREIDAQDKDEEESPIVYDAQFGRRVQKRSSAISGFPCYHTTSTRDGGDRPAASRRYHATGSPSSVGRPDGLPNDHKCFVKQQIAATAGGMTKVRLVEPMESVAPLRTAECHRGAIPAVDADIVVMMSSAPSDDALAAASRRPMRGGASRGRATKSTAGVTTAPAGRSQRAGATEAFLDVFAPPELILSLPSGDPRMGSTSAAQGGPVGLFGVDDLY